MFRLQMFCRTKEELDRIKVPDEIPETMTLEEYKRLKSLNFSLGSAYENLERDIIGGYVDYSAGLDNQDELVGNINKVREVLRHFEKEMQEKYKEDSGLDDGKQLHVYKFGMTGPGTRMTYK